MVDDLVANPAGLVGERDATIDIVDRAVRRPGWLRKYEVHLLLERGRRASRIDLEPRRETESLKARWFGEGLGPHRLQFEGGAFRESPFGNPQFGALGAGNDATTGSNRHRAVRPVELTAGKGRSVSL